MNLIREYDLSKPHLGLAEYKKFAGNVAARAIEYSITPLISCIALIFFLNIAAYYETNVTELKN